MHATDVGWKSSRMVADVLRMRLSAKQGQIGRERLVSNFTTSLRQLGGATVPAGGFHFNERRHALRTITAFPGTKKQPYQHPRLSVARRCSEPKGLKICTPTSTALSWAHASVAHTKKAGPHVRRLPTRKPGEMDRGRPRNLQHPVSRRLRSYGRCPAWTPCPRINHGQWSAGASSAANVVPQVL
jgi:hypothetical protein